MSVGMSDAGTIRASVANTEQHCTLSLALMTPAYLLADKVHGCVYRSHLESSTYGKRL